MKIAVLADAAGWHFKDLCRSAEKISGLQLTPVSFANLHSVLNDQSSHVFAGSTCLNQVDCVLARAMPGGTLQQIVFRMDALQELVRQSIPVINSPKTIETSVDKYLSLSLIRRSGVAVPETGVFQDANDAMRFFERHHDVVLKPIFGSEGRGLHRFQNAAAFESWIRENEGANGMGTSEQSAAGIGSVFYLQEYLPHTFDLRILVIGDELFGMKRVNAGNWITNASQGAKCFPFIIPPAEQDIARRAASAVNGKFIGVDLVYDLSGHPRVIEVNAAPGWRAISTTLDVDIAERILRMVECEARAELEDDRWPEAESLP